ncbi:MAG: DNA polymerase I, partial [Deltaproteobacteria bacterium]|nr:DNA polymerase I [Deltaproteobacteria bacterium]
MERWPYESIWLIDFEFNALPGENPNVVCMVAWDVRTGRKIRLWQDQLERSLPPFPVGRDSLFVAYAFTAEASCFLSLNWPLPQNILDLYVEFVLVTNGTYPVAGTGLIGALTHFGLPSITVHEKESWRGLIVSGGPWDEEQKRGILSYCESDVEA